MNERPNKDRNQPQKPQQPPQRKPGGGKENVKEGGGWQDKGGGANRPGRKDNIGDKGTPQRGFDEGVEKDIDDDNE